MPAAAPKNAVIETPTSKEAAELLLAPADLGFSLLVVVVSAFDRVTKHNVSGFPP